jgi:integrase
MKGRLDFTLPLSDQAVELLQTIPQEGRYVFNQFKAWGAAKRRLDKRINAARKKPIEPWVLHGLRATFSTIMRERDLATHEIVEECLSHKPNAKQGVAGVYNKAAYAQQKRDAMQAWGKLVAELTG